MTLTEMILSGGMYDLLMLIGLSSILQVERSYSTVDSSHPFACNVHHWTSKSYHCAKKPVTTMLTYPSKCTVLHCTHLGNTWKPMVLITQHFDYCPSASEGDNQSVRSSAPVVSRCFPGGYNVKLYISRGRIAWWLLAFFVLFTRIICTFFLPYTCKASIYLYPTEIINFMYI